MARQWSYSSLTNYEKCPRKYYFSKVEGHSDPAGPAAQRGVKIHAAIEDYLNRETDDLPKKVEENFGKELEVARDKEAIAELEFSLDQNWERTDWDTAWVRGKMDIVLPEVPLIVDIKTGRYYPTHRDQSSIYALASLKMGITTDVAVEMWYTDLNETMCWDWTKRKLEGNVQSMWEHRAERLDKETEWPAKPSYLCKWCAFSAAKGGQCDAG